MKATVHDASNAEPIDLSQWQPIEWRVSLWFVVLSPLLGILLGMLALIVFAV